jgi:carboxyl-terminal processing protease
LLIIVIAALAFGISFSVVQTLSPASREAELMTEAYNILQKYYVNPDKVTPELLTEDSVADMLDALDDPYTYYITRAQYAWLMEYFGEESPTVYGELIDDIAYIVIDHFSDSTDDNLLSFLEDAPEGLDGVILDLRDNPGGVVDSAAEVADQFLAEGIIYSIWNGRGEVPTEVVVAESQELFTEDAELKVAILINGNTASAAEMVAAALQDSDGEGWERVCLIGTKTYGKGCIGYIVPLSDGSAISVICAYWYTPSRYSIKEYLTAGDGLTPDSLVEDDPEQEGDEQLQAAIAYINSF